MVRIILALLLIPSLCFGWGTFPMQSDSVPASGSAYTNEFTATWTAADTGDAKTADGWTSEIDASAIGGIVSNTYQIDHDGVNFTRLNLTANPLYDEDWEIAFKFKFSDLTAVDTQGVSKGNAIITINTGAGAFLQLYTLTDVGGDYYRWLVISYNDAGSAAYSYLVGNLTAATYVDVVIQSDVGAAATADGVLSVTIDGTAIINDTGRSDETRPVITEVRFGLTANEWNQPNTLNFDDFTYGWK